MNSPNPALVSHRAAQRLPRLALLLLCAAYVLPGLFFRDPWKNADITAFGYMVNMADGSSSWLSPTVAGLPSDAALLPYWLGAAFIKMLGPMLGAPLAARIPFALLLVSVLALTWYSTYYLARTEAAQPLPFAFGGEADPVDYARAIADGALLALIASLGLLQLGHETTPELVQLASVSLFTYALSASAFPLSASAFPLSASASPLGASAFHARLPRFALVVALPALAASGAPSIAAALGIAGLVVCRRSSYPRVRSFAVWVMVALALAIATAFALGAWGWRLTAYESRTQILSLVKQLLWFTWPAWPLACWTLWRWRRHLLHRHIAVPLSSVLVALVACVLMGGSDRALMLALPSLAVLAAFTLPTLQRSTAAALDWFSVFFFTISALAIWVIYFSMRTGVPHGPAANIAKLAPGFVSQPSLPHTALAVAGSIAWLWLVRWRTGRHRHPLWKSMVLPASGVALSWLLLMTLFLPLFDFARSYRPLIDRIARTVPTDACISAVDLPRGELVALEHIGDYRVDALTPAGDSRCEFLMRIEGREANRAPPSGWRPVAREWRPTNRDEVTAVYRRVGAANEGRPSRPGDAISK